MKKITSKDGCVEYTYYERDKVEIRFTDFTGFVITVYKPGRKPHQGTRTKLAYKSPCIDISQSCKTSWTFKELSKFPTYVREAIVLLNSEGFDLISPDFTLSAETVPFTKVCTTKPRSIPTAKIVKNAIYEQENGSRYIFIHKGSVFKTIPGFGRNRINRESCPYAYLRVSSNEGFTINNSTLVFDGRSCGLDTVSNPRRFIKKVEDIPYWDTLVEVPYKGANPILYHMENN